MADNRLFDAASVGDTRVLEQLLIQDPNVLENVKPYGETACHVALEHGHLEFASKVSSHYPLILGYPDKKNSTPLHFALMYGYTEFFADGVRLLLNYFGGLLDSFDGLQRARESFKCRGEFVNKQNKSLLYLAVENGYVEAIKIVLETPLLWDRMETYESTALQVAIKLRNYDIIQLLLQHMPTLARVVTPNRNSPLHLAVSMAELKIVDMLLNTDTTPVNFYNEDGLSPFHIAASMGYKEIFELLLRLCPDCYLLLTVKQENALHLAVQNYRDSIVEVIMKDKKLNEHMINQQDEDGNTPLHIAASIDYYNLQNILLASGVKVQKDLKNKELCTFGDITQARKELKFKEKREQLENKWVEAMKEFQNSLLVMATLITTVSFTAAFTLPGGYNGDEPNQGMATLVGRAGFKVFLISDTLSMGSSIIATAALIQFSVIIDTRKRFSTLKVAMTAMGISIIFMLVTFGAGVWVVIGSQNKWLAIFIVTVTCTTLLPLSFVVADTVYQSIKEGVRVGTSVSVTKYTD